LLRDKVVPFFEENGLRLQRILTDRGTEYCGKYCNGKTPIKTFFDSVDLAKNYYIEKAYKREDVEKENDEYILPST